MKTGKEVKSILKSNGFNSRDFSVSTATGSYDVKIKNLQVSKTAVKESLKSLEHYDRCEATGEILQGGNTFLMLSYDNKAVRDFVNANAEFITRKISERYSLDTSPRFIKYHGANSVKEFFNISEDALGLAIKEIY